MPTWPATLPQYVAEGGFVEQLPQNTIRTQMEAGPPKARRRFTTAPRRFQIALDMTPEQADIFEDFYTNTLQDGVLSFTWVHPRTRAPMTFTFDDTPPRAQTFGSGGTVRYSFTLESQP